MKKKTIKLLLWVLKKLNANVFIVPDEVCALLPKASQQIMKTDAIKDLVSSEFKHANTFAYLVKNNPNAQPRHIGLAIELVLNGY